MAGVEGASSKDAQMGKPWLGDVFARARRAGLGRDCQSDGRDVVVIEWESSLERWRAEKQGRFAQPWSAKHTCRPSGGARGKRRHVPDTVNVGLGK